MSQGPGAPRCRPCPRPGAQFPPQTAARGDAGPGAARRGRPGCLSRRDAGSPPLTAGAGAAAGAGALEVRGGGAGRRLPSGCAEALPSETHVLLRRAAAAEAWPRAAAVRGALRGAPAWRRALPPGPGPGPGPDPGSPPPLPLVPGGFAAPRPPFFAPLPPALRARRLVLGHEHVLALGAAGETYAWGGGRHGQLGHGVLEPEPEPRLVEALAGVPMRELAAGGWHSASVSEAGDLYVWGWNESGQLALPSKALAEERAQAEGAGAGEAELTPRREQPGAEGAEFISIQAFPALLDFPHDLEVSKVGCGSRHTAAVTRDGALYTWGWGKYGQLGHGDNASSDQQRRVDYLRAKGLRAEDVVCGPWTTYVCVLEE
ncbi:RCC1 domain-containing protein 1 isoform X2 [Dromaius novaehollandiae]|uniref:RCC1 domain-containing protein 1 isoform X2 n=1 Tax=Dromaius novaehollandiae TaxID=8790 RepID=UPI00311F06E9